jgi:hypothetical protein
VLQRAESDSLDRQLKLAITKRHLIQFKYGSTIRIAEPHDYGLLQGAPRLLAYQLRDERPGPPGWRLLDLAKMEGLVMLPRTFQGSRGAMHRNHYGWDELFARVD